VIAPLLLKMFGPESPAFRMVFANSIAPAAPLSIPPAFSLAELLLIVLLVTCSPLVRPHNAVVNR
jgi:hypothetical protein